MPVPIWTPLNGRPLAHYHLPQHEWISNIFRSYEDYADAVVKCQGRSFPVVRAIVRCEGLEEACSDKPDPVTHRYTISLPIGSAKAVEALLLALHLRDPVSTLAASLDQKALEQKQLVRLGGAYILACKLKACMAVDILLGCLARVLSEPGGSTTAIYKNHSRQLSKASDSESDSSIEASCSSHRRLRRVRSASSNTAEPTRKRLCMRNGNLLPTTSPASSTRSRPKYLNPNVVGAIPKCICTLWTAVKNEVLPAGVRNFTRRLCIEVALTYAPEMKGNEEWKEVRAKLPDFHQDLTDALVEEADDRDSMICDCDTCTEDEERVVYKSAIGEKKATLCSILDGTAKLREVLEREEVDINNMKTGLAQKDAASKSPVEDTKSGIVVKVEMDVKPVI